jgi:dynein heavy chain 2
MNLVTPKISRGYGVKNFKNDLKAVMQQTGIEGDQAVLLLEDYQFLEQSFLELINSLLSAGEIPGLYTPEELEPLLTPLRDLASEANFRGTMMQFFASSMCITLNHI